MVVMILTTWPIYLSLSHQEWVLIMLTVLFLYDMKDNILATARHAARRIETQLWYIIFVLELIIPKLMIRNAVEML